MLGGTMLSLPCVCERVRASESEGDAEWAEGLAVPCGASERTARDAERSRTMAAQSDGEASRPLFHQTLH